MSRAGEEVLEVVVGADQLLDLAHQLDVDRLHLLVDLLHLLLRRLQLLVRATGAPRWSRASPRWPTCSSSFALSSSSMVVWRLLPRAAGAPARARRRSAVGGRGAARRPPRLRGRGRGLAEDDSVEAPVLLAGGEGRARRSSSRRSASVDLERQPASIGRPCPSLMARCSAVCSVARSGRARHRRRRSARALPAASSRKLPGPAGRRRGSSPRSLTSTAGGANSSSRRRSKARRRPAAVGRRRARSPLDRGALEPPAAPMSGKMAGGATRVSSRWKMRCSLSTSAEELGVAREVLRGAEEEVAAGGQRVVEEGDELLLDLGLEVDEEVAARDRDRASRRGLDDDVVRGEDAHVADLLAHLVAAPVLRKKRESRSGETSPRRCSGTAPSAPRRAPGRRCPSRRSSPRGRCRAWPCPRARGWRASTPPRRWRSPGTQRRTPRRRRGPRGSSGTTLLGDRREDLRIAEEAGDADQQIVEEQIDLARVVLEQIDVVGERAPPAIRPMRRCDAPEHGGLLVPGEVVARPAEDGRADGAELLRASVARADGGPSAAAPERERGARRRRSSRASRRPGRPSRPRPAAIARPRHPVAARLLGPWAMVMPPAP